MENTRQYIARLIFNGRELIEHFDNSVEAVEWCCIRLESIGEQKEKFARASVTRGNAMMWEMPETSAAKPNGFNFAHFEVK
jgi:hypothetical protein